jgi:hypothetical protein
MAIELRRIIRRHRRVPLNHPMSTARNRYVRIAPRRRAADVDEITASQGTRRGISC